MQLVHTHLRQWALAIVPREDLKIGIIDDLEWSRKHFLLFLLAVGLTRVGVGGQKQLLYG